MVDRQMMSEVGPVFIRSCLAQANFECDDIVTIDRYEPDALAICTPALSCSSMAPVNYAKRYGRSYVQFSSTTPCRQLHSAAHPTRWSMLHYDVAEDTYEALSYALSGHTSGYDNKHFISV